MRPLHQALGPIARPQGDGLVLRPTSERELSDALMELRARGQALGPALELDRSALNHLSLPNEENLTIEAGAGVWVRDVEAMARRHRLTCGSLASSSWDRTVGELVDHSACAFRSVAGGGLEPVASRLTVVTGNGDILRSSLCGGPDVASLFAGSAGRFGVVTSAQLRLLELHTTEQRRVYSFETAQQLCRALRDSLAEGIEYARVIASSSGERRLMEATLMGRNDHVIRAFELLDRCLAKRGGRFEGPGHSSETDAIDAETTWQAVSEALAAGKSLTLYRLSLGSVIARGVQPTPFRFDSILSEVLRTALDASSILGKPK